MTVPAVYSQPPESNPQALREGDFNTAVASLQRTLKQLGWDGTEDGSFGEQTRVAVVRYQRNRDLAADGIAGQATQKRAVLGWLRDASKARELPDGLLEGVVEGESGYWLGAVNWSVKGGVDCGALQRRVYGPPFDAAAVQRAFDTRYQARLVARTTRERHDTYMARGAVRDSRAPSEMAWRLAVLAHNWPWGAERLSQGEALSDRTASWVPDGVKFDDGQPVVTFAEWAAFYAMGSRPHRHAGKMVERAFGLPSY